MKISDVVYSTVEEVAAMKKFDMNEMPRKAKWYLRPLAWLLAYPETWKHHPDIRRHQMKGIKPPYVLLCNHNSFFDFKVATRALFPHMANYIVAIDGFINREELMREVGCVLKRKFVPDAPLIKKIKHGLVKHKYISAIYPEARYSLVGTTALLPDSLGKMIKLLDMPVVMLICHGHHLMQPVWNLTKRKLKTSADLTLLLDREAIAATSIDQINHKVREAFFYDDFAYQYEHQIHINYPKRAEGLHKVLYQCPRCLAEQSMTSNNHMLACSACGKTWEMDTLGRLKATSGATEFPHIPDWYEWERAQVRRQIEAGAYRIDTDVHVDVLPNSTGFYRLGIAHLLHDDTGFHLNAIWDGKPFAVEKGTLENYGIHIEYAYFGRGDGISISTLHDTYYLYAVDQSISVTKIHFAVEELYKLKVKEVERHADKAHTQVPTQI